MASFTINRTNLFKNQFLMPLLIQLKRYTLFGLFSFFLLFIFGMYKGGQYGGVVMHKMQHYVTQMTWHPHLPIKITKQIREESPFLAHILDQLNKKKQFDINQLDGYGFRALHYAVHLSDPFLVRVLLAYGADPDATSSANRTALHAAAVAGNLEVFNLLLSTKMVDVNRQDDYEETPLFLAVEADHVEIVDQLLVHPMVRVMVPNFLDKTCLDVALAKEAACLVGTTKTYNAIIEKILAKLPHTRCQGG